MNLFAVNAAEVNGSIEVWSWYGASEVAIQAQGEGIRGATLSGASALELQSDAIGVLHVRPTGLPSQIALASTGEAIYGRSGSGTSTIQINAAGDGTRWVLGESASDIVIESDGDAQVVQPAAASSDIIVQSSIDERVTPALFGEGVSQIVFDGLLVDTLARPVRMPASAAEIVLASRAIAHLVIDLPPASMQIEFAADGNARLGGKVYADPLPAELSLFSRCDDSSMLRYVYAEPVQAVIELRLASLQAGIPPIPTEYVPAPTARTITVSRDLRDMRVARENRSL